MGKKMIRHDGMGVGDAEWQEYEYLFDLIQVRIRSPYLQGYHPKEEVYDLLKMVAESDIRSSQLRRCLVGDIEEYFKLNTT